MTYPCGIIRDLLPLYIDDVCNEESKQAVENHLSECEKCRNYYNSMKSTEGFVAKENYYGYIYQVSPFLYILFLPIHHFYKMGHYNHYLMDKNYQAIH